MNLLKDILNFTFGVAMLVLTVSSILNVLMAIFTTASITGLWITCFAAAYMAVFVSCTAVPDAAWEVERALFQVLYERSGAGKPKYGQIHIK